MGELMCALEAEQELLCLDGEGLALVLASAPLWRGRRLGRDYGMGAICLSGQTHAGQGGSEWVVAWPPSWGGSQGAYSMLQVRERCAGGLYIAKSYQNI